MENRNITKIMIQRIQNYDPKKLIENKDYLHDLSHEMKRETNEKITASQTSKLN